MRKKELVSRIAESLRNSDYRKPVKVPRHTFHISDDEGNTKDFVVQQSDKQVMLTVDDVSQVVDTCFEMIGESLKRGEPVYIVGFGTFGLKFRAPRRVPLFTGDGFRDLEGHYVPTFKFGERLRACGRLYEESLKDRIFDPAEHPYDESADESLTEGEVE